MKQRLAPALALAALLALPATVAAAPIEFKVVTGCSGQSYTVGQVGQATGLATGELCDVVTANSGPDIGITPTDRTITSATGASQQVMAANATRHGLIIQNTGTSNCGVNPTGGTAVIGGAATLTLVPNGSYQPAIPTLSAVTAICTAGQPLYAEEK